MATWPVLSAVDDAAFAQQNLLQTLKLDRDGEIPCTGVQQWDKGADVTPATGVLTLGNDGNSFDVAAGNFASIVHVAVGGSAVQAGTIIKLHFDGVSILTHHTTNLILPGGANITTAAGDEMEFMNHDGAAHWRCTKYSPASGIPITGIVPVANGGTGLATVAAGSYLKGNVVAALVPRTPAEVKTDLAIAQADVSGLTTAAGPTFDHLHLTSGQLGFPAVQVPSADVNTLDDYEEGTWTPVVEFGGASVSITYGTRVGTYTKIGQLVHVMCYIALTNKGSSVGAMGISGLPFVSGALISVPARFYKVTFANAFQGRIASGASIIYFTEITEAGVETDIANTDFANDSELCLFAVYKV